MSRSLFILISLFFLSTLSAEQSLQEKLGIVQANEYVQLEMPNGKMIILYKARIHLTQLIGTPVTYDKKKKKYVLGEGNSPSYYASRITKISAFDIKQKPKK